MKSLLRTLTFWSLAIAIAVIAVANRNTVALSFDPFSSQHPAVVVELRQFWIILGAGLIGIVLGGWSSWLAQAPLRQALRDNEEKLRRLEREVEVAQTIIVKPSPGRAVDLRRA
jgi:uncharacterized integral membrane protein